MRLPKRTLLLAPLLLGACEGRTGTDDKAGEAAGGNMASPEGKSEEGKLSIKAPGFDMKINIPKGLADEVNVDSDSEVIYPGSTVGGMHIEAGSESGGKRESGVELRFNSRDPIDKVVAWYREPARASGFAVARAAREGNAVLIEGTQKKDGDPFSLRLSPAGTGTEGRLTLSDRR